MSISVRANCSGSTKSGWTGPFAFTTSCATVSTFPFLKNFSAGIPSCWATQQVVGAGSWAAQASPTVVGSSTNTITSDHGTGTLWFNAYNFNDNSRSRAITPRFSLTAGAAYEVELVYSQDAGFSSSLDSLYLQVSTNNGATWTNVAGFQRYKAGLASPTWTTAIVALTPYAGQTVTVGLLGVSKYGNNVIVDKFAIEQFTLCSGTPNTGTASYTKTFCPAPSVTLTSTGYTEGPGTTYQWEVTTDRGSKPGTLCQEPLRLPILLALRKPTLTACR